MASVKNNNDKKKKKKKKKKKTPHTQQKKTPKNVTFSVISSRDPCLNAQS